MPLPRIPGASADPERAARRAQGRARFLLVTFSLREQRKVTRPKGRKPLLLLLLEIYASDKQPHE
ncbi:hypothetical protein, partial [uncultured Xanthomonas sp.]|uniref:hypothetical protein n=1 Tax=uncultured Xanthomonas sp. TaxID=152831 RepID=UPI0025E16C5F